MYRKENTTTTRLTTEIIRSIARALLAKAEELEHFQRMQDDTALTKHPSDEYAL